MQPRLSFRPFRVQRRAPPGTGSRGTARPGPARRRAAARRPGRGEPRSTRCRGGAGWWAQPHLEGDGFPREGLHEDLHGEPGRAARLPDLLPEWRRPERAPRHTARGFHPRRRKGGQCGGTTAPGVPHRSQPRCGLLGAVVSPPQPKCAMGVVGGRRDREGRGTAAPMMHRGSSRAVGARRWKSGVLCTEGPCTCRLPAH